MDDLIFAATANVLGSEFKFIALFNIYIIYVCVCVILNLSIDGGEAIIPILTNDVAIIKATDEMLFGTKRGMFYQ